MRLPKTSFIAWAVVVSTITTLVIVPFIRKRLPSGTSSDGTA